MANENEELGSIEKADGYYNATLTRDIDQDQATVWSMLTKPSHFVNWLAPGEIELAQGGRATLNFTDSGIVIDSEVTKCQAPSLLEYSWSSGDEPQRPIRWELEPIDQRTRLSLTLGIPEDEEVARSCAGWEAHLMMMLAALEGVPIKFPFERFQATREAYKEMMEND
ncbi:MAG: SRPBCC family protein [bacterium]